jgi:hypothetical protein
LGERLSLPDLGAVLTADTDPAVGDAPLARSDCPFDLRGCCFLGLVADHFEHEAMRVEKERRVAVLAVLGERPRRVEDLIAAIADPLVDAVHIGARWNEKRYVLEPDPVP